MRRLVGLLPVLPLLIGLAAWPPPVASGAVASEDRAQVTMSTVTLTIDSCPDCTFSLIRSKKDGTVGFATEAATPDDAGQVAFSVPTDQLRGILISARAPDNTSGRAQYVVVRFKDLAPGDPVSRKKAQSSSKGSPCWAGSSATEVALDVAVRRRVGESDDQVVAYDMWTTTTQRWWNPMLPTVGGSLEAVDVVPCSKKG